LDKPTANKLLGIGVYEIDFQADDETYSQMVQLLHAIFKGLDGLTVAQ